MAATGKGILVTCLEKSVIFLFNVDSNEPWKWQLKFIIAQPSVFERPRCIAGSLKTVIFLFSLTLVIRLVKERCICWIYPSLPSKHLLSLTRISFWCCLHQGFCLFFGRRTSCFIQNRKGRFWGIFRSYCCYWMFWNTGIGNGRRLCLFDKLPQRNCCNP